MKETRKNTILLIIVILIMGSISTSIVYLEKTVAQEEFDRAFHTGVELGCLQGELNAMEFIDYQFCKFDGRIDSIEQYDAFNISDMGTNWVLENGSVFVPYQFIIYKINLDFAGFSWYEPSPYVSNTSGIYHASFRYCRDCPITEPGHYKFYYLDIDIMEITHWEKM